VSAPNDTKPEPPLLLIKGNATSEEVAAVVAILQAASAGAAPAPEPKRSHWANPGRTHRALLHHGPDGWRASGLAR